MRTTTLLTAKGVPSKRNSGHSMTWLTGGKSMANTVTSDPPCESRA